MKVICLRTNPIRYSCSSYLILGEWNRLEDVNTLIDAGVDGYVLEEIAGLSTGVGKRAVEQVILTHGHFDHCAGAKFIKQRYGCTVKAFSPLKHVDRLVRDGQVIRCGDRDFEVIHTPGHSNDSVCLYCREEKALFSGDTPLFIRTAGGSYNLDFVQTLERLANLDIAAIYPGHGPPVRARIREMLSDTLRNVHKSRIITSGQDA